MVLEVAVHLLLAQTLQLQQEKRVVLARRLLFLVCLQLMLVVAVGVDITHPMLEAQVAQAVVGMVHITPPDHLERLTRVGVVVGVDLLLLQVFFMRVVQAAQA